MRWPTPACPGWCSPRPRPSMAIRRRCRSPRPPRPDRPTPTAAPSSRSTSSSALQARRMGRRPPWGGPRPRDPPHPHRAPGGGRPPGRGPGVRHRLPDPRRQRRARLHPRRGSRTSASAGPACRRARPSPDLQPGQRGRVLGPGGDRGGPGRHRAPDPEPGRPPAGRGPADPGRIQPPDRQRTRLGPREARADHDDRGRLGMDAGVRPGGCGVALMSRTDFQWMTGFESSAFPQIGTDELEETQHYRWWASDLVRVREVGITLIRYGIPWHRVNPRPHEYDWRWSDQALDLMQVLGITPIVDLFHYGTPLWIDGGIMHPIFGELQGWYARAFAERYPHVLYYTPTNEPYICAIFGAELAV